MKRGTPRPDGKGSSHKWYTVIIFAHFFPGVGNQPPGQALRTGRDMPLVGEKQKTGFEFILLATRRCYLVAIRSRGAEGIGYRKAGERGIVRIVKMTTKRMGMGRKRGRKMGYTAV